MPIERSNNDLLDHMIDGGIGVTDEYAGSHYFKVLTQLEMTWGDTLHHLGEVSDHMQDTAGVFV